MADTGSRSFLVGHSGTRLVIPDNWLVLDIGSGHDPHSRANVLVDRYPGASIHRSDGVLVRDERPLIIGDALALPFADNAFDLVIASHIAEHIPEPELFCSELARVARRGYVETPGPLSDYFLGEHQIHLWSVRSRPGPGLEFKKLLKPESVFGRFVSRMMYAVFYMGERRARWTWCPKTFQTRAASRPLLWTKKALVKLWPSSVLRRWTYTCVFFEGSLAASVEAGRPAGTGH